MAKRALCDLSDQAFWPHYLVQGLSVLVTVAIVCLLNIQCSFPPKGFSTQCWSWRLHCKPSLKLVAQNHHSTMLMDSGDHRFVEDTVGTVCSCSMTAGSSAEKTQSPGWLCYHLEASLCTGVWWLSLAIDWGFIWGYWPEHLLFFSMWPGLPQCGNWVIKASIPREQKGMT